MSRSPCPDSVRVRGGKLVVRERLVCAQLPDRSWVHVTGEQQLRRLEKRHGRLRLLDLTDASEPGALAIAVAAQSHAAAPADAVVWAEQAVAARSLPSHLSDLSPTGRVAGEGAARRRWGVQGEEIQRAVERATAALPGTPPRALAGEIASTLAAGPPQSVTWFAMLSAANAASSPEALMRAARHAASHGRALDSDEAARLSALAARTEGLRLTDPVLIGELATTLIRCAASGAPAALEEETGPGGVELDALDPSSLLHWENISALRWEQLDDAASKEVRSVMIEIGGRLTSTMSPWTSSSYWIRGQEPPSSGLKLHVWCRDEEEVLEVLNRVLPAIHGRDIRFKCATRELLSETDATPQSRKGVVLYLPDRTRACEDIELVHGVMAGWKHPRAIPGDTYVGNGVSLRHEWVLDPGVDLEYGAFARALYRPDEGAVRGYEVAEGWVERLDQAAALWSTGRCTAEDVERWVEHLPSSKVPGTAALLSTGEDDGRQLLAAVRLAHAGLPCPRDFYEELRDPRYAEMDRREAMRAARRAVEAEPTAADVLSVLRAGREEEDPLRGSELDRVPAVIRGLAAGMSLEEVARAEVDRIAAADPELAALLAVEEEESPATTLGALSKALRNARINQRNHADPDLARGYRDLEGAVAPDVLREMRSERVDPGDLEARSQPDSRALAELLRRRELVAGGAPAALVAELDSDGVSQLKHLSRVSVEDGLQWLQHLRGGMDRDAVYEAAWHRWSPTDPRVTPGLQKWQVS